MYSDSITVERLEQIEQERNTTLANPAFVQWMQELNVSSSYVDKSLIYNARQAMQEWDSSRLNLEPINRLCM